MKDHADILKEKFSSAIDKPDTLIFIKEGFTPPISIKRNQQQTTRTSYLTKIKPKATYYWSLCLDLMTTLLMDPYNAKKSREILQNRT